MDGDPGRRDYSRSPSCRRKLSREAVDYLVEMIQGKKQVEVMRKFSPSIVERNEHHGISQRETG